MVSAGPSPKSRLASILSSFSLRVRPTVWRAAAADVREAGGEAFTLELDLFARGDASERLENFLSANGLICDVLVNSAGYGLRGAASALPIDDQLGIIDLNIRALSDLTLRFLPGMVRRGVAA